MLEIFVYPVSVVMKFWHFLLADVFSMERTAAWVFSIVGLIITVRLLLLPLNWSMKRSSRRSVLMRPEMAALEAELGHSTDPADVQALMDRKQELHDKYGYRLGAGCIPPLIQLPVLLGLYRLLLWLGRPDSHPSADGSVGVLSATDVAEFQHATIFGIPVPAYLSMPNEQLAVLGTTSAAVRDVLLPLLLAAVLFTTVNMIISVIWSYRTMDWTTSLVRGMFKFMVVLTILTPGLLFVAGYFGPVPVALILYWFLNNLWTLAQNVIMTWLIASRYPEGEEHKLKRAEDKQKVLDAQAQAKAEKRELAQRRQAIKRASPDEAARLREEIQKEQKRRADEAAHEKARAKQIAQEQARIRRDIAHRRAAEKKAAREKKD